MNVNGPIIWILWFQGESQAPYLVKKCIKSWKDKNPDWDVIVLDRDSLEEYIDISDIPKDLPMPQLSDVVRLRLLNKYGGVWADSTTYCRLPLNTWLPKNQENKLDLFLFTNSNWHVGISSWFISSERNEPILLKLERSFSNYWSDDLVTRQTSTKVFFRRVLSKVISHNERLLPIWFSWFVRHVLKVYPYFAFHYMLSVIVNRDSSLLERWSIVKQNTIENDIPHAIQNIGMLSLSDEEKIEKLRLENSPLYKLTYRYEEKNYNDNCLLYHVLNDLI